MVRSSSVESVILKLDDFRDEGFRVVDEGTSYYNLCILELFCLSPFSICRSSHVKHNHHWLISTISLSPPERSPVLTLFHSFL